jgi:hypothetical protein
MADPEAGRENAVNVEELGSKAEFQAEDDLAGRVASPPLPAAAVPLLLHAAIGGADDDNGGRGSRGRFPPPQSVSAVVSSLAALRFFWTALWYLCLELCVCIFAGVLAAVSLAAGAKKEDSAAEAGFAPLLQQNLYPPGPAQEEEEPTMDLPEDTARIFLMLGIPAVVGLCGAAVVLSLRRSQALAGAVILFVSCAVALAGGVAGTWFAGSRALSVFLLKSCEARVIEGWSLAVVRTMEFVLAVWPCWFRVMVGWSALRLILLRNNGERLDRSYVHGHAPATKAAAVPSVNQAPQPPRVTVRYPPFHHGLEKGISIWMAAITICCLPKTLHKKLLDNTEKAHHYHHGFQLFWESLLLVAAIFEVKYIELTAIAAGLVGALVMTLGFSRFGIVLNTFAVWMTLAIQVFDGRHLGECVRGEAEIKTANYL